MVKLVYDQDVRDLDNYDHDFKSHNMRAWVAASLYRIKQNTPRSDSQVIQVGNLGIGKYISVDDCEV